LLSWANKRVGWLGFAKHNPEHFSFPASGLETHNAEALASALPRTRPGPKTCSPAAETTGVNLEWKNLTVSGLAASNQVALLSLFSFLREKRA
jgi:hypothetical protein